MKKLITSFLATLLMVAISYAQSIITVDNSSGANAQFDNLQSAISLASDGDIIYVHPSEITYPSIIIDKALTIIGFSHSDPDKITKIDEVFLEDGSSNTRITGIRVLDDIENTSNNGINNLIIENCKIDDGFISNNSSSALSNVILRGNVINRIGNSSDVISNFVDTIITNNIIISSLSVNFPESVIVKNNIFLNAGIDNDEVTANLVVQNSIFITSSNNEINFNSTGVLFENCLAYNIGNGNVTPLTGTNNIENIDPQFLNLDNLNYNFTDNYQLQEGSIAIGAGVNGEDLGIFDGPNFVFNNSGFTQGIPTVAITSIDATVQEGADLQVTIQSNSN